MAKTSAVETDDLTVVVPVYNEADSLPTVLPALLSYCSKRGWRVVLVNDGSTDDTARILREYESEPILQIVHHKVNRGYGGALKTGIAVADTEFVVTIDADGQHRLEDIDRLADLMRSNDADMVVGSRRGQRGRSWYREIGKWIIRSVARLMMPMPIHDINSGFKVYRTKLAQAITAWCPDTMAFSDLMTLSFIYARLKVIEAPITVTERIGGKSTVTTKAALQTVQELVNVTMLFRPIRVYFPMAAVLFVMGSLWGTHIVLAGRGVSVGAMLVIVTSLLLLFIGLLGEQIAMLRRSTVERSIRSLDRPAVWSFEEPPGDSSDAASDDRSARGHEPRR